jgi:hypothetical protein
MKRLSFILALGLLLTVGATVIHAQSGGGYDLTWNTLDGGGGIATGGNYILVGTIGQADAGNPAGGAYTLSGGFWSASAQNYSVYLPLILK